MSTTTIKITIAPRVNVPLTLTIVIPTEDGVADLYGAEITRADPGMVNRISLDDVRETIGNDESERAEMDRLVAEALRAQGITVED